MPKLLFISILFCIIIPIKGLSQSAVLQSTASPDAYHYPSEDKISWQRLLLQLGSIYFHIVREGQVDLDNSLFYASHSLGLSRIPVIADGIDDPELFAQSPWIDQKNPAKGIRLLSRTRGKTHLELLVLLGAYYAFQPRQLSLLQR